MKRCPRLHANPRGADVCSKCGSRELSTPQPKVPASWKLLAILVRLGAGLALFAATLTFLVVVARSRELEQALVGIGLVLVSLWLAFTKLPDWLQEAIRRAVLHRRDDEDA
ncbi:MAG: hypothetical protein ACLGSD_00400 [Acidobacteriota bacterium]